ncbi:hypothetical protein BDV29DRAFT_147861 [Aspergillus leporis]|uniref:Uncharacterized protein n=1 Tax=Aspergillus leporis TaxID=41062 RepID=A0A5N5WW14_9EURO|nr:hypothetical protein BDV29DRAFT_147861 [Aspergillus leporis]
MQFSSLPWLTVISTIVAFVAAETASVYNQRGCNGTSTIIPWSQCIPTYDNKSITVPTSQTPEQVLFNCYLYSMKSDTTCQEDRQQPTAGCTDNLYYYSKCVFVPAPGFVSLYEKPNFEGSSTPINITTATSCLKLSPIWPSGQIGSIVVTEGYTCGVFRMDGCMERIGLSVGSPGDADLNWSDAKSMLCLPTRAKSPL